MAGQCKEPGHQQKWYCPRFPWIFHALCDEGSHKHIFQYTITAKTSSIHALVGNMIATGWPGPLHPCTSDKMRHFWDKGVPLAVVWAKRKIWVVVDYQRKILQAERKYNISFCFIYYIFLCGMLISCLNPQHWYISSLKNVYFLYNKNTFIQMLMLFISFLYS